MGPEHGVQTALLSDCIREDRMTLVRARDGTVNLHLWRHGQEYLAQKGPIFLKEWNNIIFATRRGPSLENTRYIDLSTRPLEFADETFDSVYAYHVFEHLTPVEGDRLAREVLRTLKRGGIFRVSVPDLESLCVQYLAKLDIASKDPSPKNLVRYQWAALIIFEQMVREYEGGLMCEMILRGEYDEAQLREECLGDSLRPLIKRVHDSSLGGRVEPPRPHWAKRLKSLTPRTFVRGLLRRIRLILGDGSPQQIDLRLTKEAVRWMHDRLSLRLLLEGAGFVSLQLEIYNHSRIPNWSRYDFDRSNHGDYPLDPSVYIEGRKP
jgi:predicted SAM-dependent methyltransferase